MIPRIALFLAISAAAFGGNLEDAAKSLAQKVLTHLAADEAASFTWQNEAPQSVKTALANAARRRIRNPKPVEIRVTLSENLRGNLLVAEIVRDGGNVVEMAGAPRDRAQAATAALRLTLLWGQEAPILDVAFFNDQMLVLDSSGLTVYQRKDAQWSKAETSPIVTMHVRDLRGHIEINKDSYIVYLPGEICERDADPRAGMHCTEGGILAADRNTLSANDWPPHYSRAEAGGEHLLAETDGRTRIYDENHKLVGTFSGWGSDFAAVSLPCGPAVIAAEAGGDAVAAYGLANHQPVAISESAALPGPVSAVWAHGTSATVVSMNAKSGQYEAFGASVDCGR